NLFCEKNNRSYVMYMLKDPGTDEELLKIRNELLDEAIQHLTKSQDEILAARFAERGLTLRHNYNYEYTYVSAYTLIKLNFPGLNKQEICERLLFGHKRKTSGNDPYDHGRTDPLKGPFRAEVFRLMDSPTIQELFQKKLYPDAGRRNEAVY